MTTIKTMNAGVRIASMLIDHLVMTIIVILIALPTISEAFEEHPYFSNGTPQAQGLGSFIFFLLFGLPLYFCKDSFNGRSVAKLILKHQVIDKKTRLAANPIKCFIRNIFIIIWPVEVIMVLINPSSRLGDKVAGTEVVYFDKEKEKQKIDFAKVFLALILAYCLLFIFCLIFNMFFPFGLRN
jgi:uncharacterized RDD family membrane protein YckC